MKRDDLIIDVGMHVGEDTAFYLAKGFNVVAIEANPTVAQAAGERFAESIDAGRLTIMPVAIAETTGVQQLAVSDEDTVWSSLCPDFVERNEAQAGTSYRYVDVPTVTFGEVLEKVGVPHYLKVDIEGLDMLCIRALRDFDERPTYVSVESNVSANHADGAAVFDEIAQLWSLGYREFKYVDQRKHQEWQPEGSGPFGEETPGRWLGPDAALRHARLLRLHHNVAGMGGRWCGTVPAKAYRAFRCRVLHSPASWYDLHARLARP